MAAGNTASVTVTGTAGAGVTVTAKSFTNITTFSVDVPNGMLFMRDINDKVTRVSITAATTFTVTISGGNYTVTIS